MSEFLVWRKSRHSADQGNCVEVASLPDGDCAVRDSKDSEGPVLRLTAGQWHRFTTELKG